MILKENPWVVDHFQKDHNHDLEIENGNCTPTVQQKGAAAFKSFTEVSRRPRKKLLESCNESSGPMGIIDFKRLRKEELEGQFRTEPYVGQEFGSPNEAYQFYHAYAAYVGFGVRIGQLFRSKNDGLITSRRFVCSKEGFQHPSRVGCGAYLRIKRQPSGKWVVDRLHKDHNHDLGSEREGRPKSIPDSNILAEEVDTGFVNGATSIEKYKLAYEILREGGRKLCWHSRLIPSLEITDFLDGLTLEPSYDKV
ncbi:hypothetical protein Ahy_A04g021322 [Arachis hypogaea]|uniref:FAR1 domain-containing protein n=1 Tax=Arachis hypogaea TaxID=3818 RepID=A0A445DJW2_ARAHY|nr:hypothetical protein Ahy_A04g021322 [Arachis hypogaea]